MVVAFLEGALFLWLESFCEFGENELILGKGWCRFCGIDMKSDDWGRYLVLELRNGLNMNIACGFLV